MVHARDVFICLASGQHHVCTERACDRKTVRVAEAPPTTPLDQFLRSGVHACGVQDDDDREVCDLTGRVYERQQLNLAESYDDEQREERARKKFRRGQDGLSLHVPSRAVRGAVDSSLASLQQQEADVKQREEVFEQIREQMKRLGLGPAGSGNGGGGAASNVYPELCSMWQRLAHQGGRSFTRTSPSTFTVVVLYSMANGGEHHQQRFYIPSRPELKPLLGPLKSHAPSVVHPKALSTYRKTDALIKRVAIEHLKTPRAAIV